MAVRPKRYFTPEEYLLLEERASYKSEYDQGEIFPLREPEVLSDGTVAMAGASPAHNRIVGNLIGLLFAGLRGGPCTVYPSDVLVGAASGEAYLYPDVTVVCGEPVFDRSILADPALIIEVMSGSTAEHDRNLKFARYRTLDSFQEYLLVAQDQCYVEHFVREPDTSWRFTINDRLDATLSLRTGDATLILRDVYEGVAEIR